MREPNEIDFWRGFALITIFINHVPGIYFERFTYRNFSLSELAELFVFLAGWSLRLQTNRTASLPILGLVLSLAGAPCRSISRSSYHRNGGRATRRRLALL